MSAFLLLLMATQGYNNPGTASSATWSNPNNALTVNGSSASRTANPPTGTIIVRNYGFTIPVTATIDGIEYEITATQDSALAEPDYSIRTQLTKDGSSGVGTALDSGLSNLPLQTIVKGGATSLHGATWTPAEVNSANFGVIAQYQGDAGNVNDILLDCIRMKIYYTDAAGGGSSSVIGYVAIRRPAINVPSGGRR